MEPEPVPEPDPEPEPEPDPETEPEPEPETAGTGNGTGNGTGTTTFSAEYRRHTAVGNKEAAGTYITYDTHNFQIFMYILGVGGGSAGGCRAHAQFFCRRRILTIFSPPLPPPPPRPPAILYSAYQQFNMFLLSSRYDLKFHTFLRGIICLHQSLHIIATAYIIVFIHYTNSSAYSATGYIIVCIQGKASP